MADYIIVNTGTKKEVEKNAKNIIKKINNQ